MNSILILSLVAAFAGPLLLAQTPAPISVETAREIVGDLSAHRFDEVVARFNPRMKAALPVERLQQVWTTLEAQVGPFQGIRGVVVAGQGSRTVTFVCHFERANLDILLTFDPTNLLSSLFFRPATGLTEWSAPPYAHAESFEEVDLTVTTGQWRLPGVLTLPKSKSPFPAVVLVQGSGPNDQDETVGANKPFKDLAWGLASRGVAVLRFTKRTARYGAASSVDPATLTVDDESIDDARSAVALLAARPEIDRRHIYVLGHSLGATLAPRIATGDSTVAGIILMAGAVTPIEQLALEQVRALVAQEHLPAEETRKRVAATEKGVEQIESPGLKPGATVDFLGSTTPASYWLDLRTYHPERTAAALHIPMLLLQGGRDYQVPVREFELWKKALAGHKNATFKLYPALNHLFIAGSGPSTPAEYLRAGHVDAPVIEEIATWIKAQTGKQ